MVLDESLGGQAILDAHRERLAPVPVVEEDV
jgi:hypothetical protein